MRVFTAHVHPTAPPRLVREGWSWGAFVFGPFWLLARRAWLAAALWAVLCCVPLLLPRGWQPIAALANACLGGLVGRDLVRWSLARCGYVLAHAVAALDEDLALARLLAAREDLVSHFLPRPELGWRPRWLDRWTRAGGAR